MSHAVVRGDPLPAQLYLDDILDEILTSKRISQNTTNRGNINLAQILYHCLKKNPSNIFAINASTDEIITNEQILQEAISLARALISKGVRGKTVILLMRNHQRMTAMYLAVLFAQALPFMQDPNSTVFELTHYLNVIEPSYVFCDEEHKISLDAALNDVPGLKTEVVVFEKDEHLKDFAKGFSDDIDGFEIPDRDSESSVMMLPTSGSTGLPKAALMTEKGLIAQLPGVWLYFTQFPKPTEMALVLTTLQWMTFTMIITSSIVYQVTMLISPKPTSVEVVKDILIKFRPTWTFFGPAFAKALLPEITSDHFSSLKHLTLLGAPTTTELLTAVKDKLPSTAQLCEGYGTTEAQGYITLQDKDGPLKCNGRVFNIFHYKLVDDNGKEVGLCQNGELLVKGISLFQRYYNSDDKIYNETVVDGWYKTGDLFYIDESERLYYLEKKKFSFKYQGCHVAPEEVERVIGLVPGVQQCVVCGTDNGPTAAVIIRPDCDVTREHICKVVDATLSDHKRLHGGIAFVTSLPHTHSGKIKRGDCKKLLEELVKMGHCY